MPKCCPFALSAAKKPEVSGADGRLFADGLICAIARAAMTNFRFCFCVKCGILLNTPFEKGRPSLKMIGRLILSAIFLILTALMVAAASWAPELVFSFYPEFSRGVLNAIASVTSLAPIALWEVLAVLLILWFFYTFVRVFTQHRSILSWLAGVVLAVSVAVFLFVGLWGLNHFGPSIDETLGLDVREYSREELIAATKYYAAQANEYAPEVARRADGTAELAGFSALSTQAGEGYDALAKQSPAFSGGLGRVKSLASAKLFSYFGNTGIFVCFTAEACVNPDTYEAWIPFTMCHELAHRQAVAAEDEANFCAYLACMESSRADFLYSGAFAAYIYCSNALYKVDRSAADEIFYSLSAGVQADIHAANEHYAQYDGAVQEAAQKVNDAYLKAFNETSGVQSYGEAADLLIAWYLQKSES